MPDSAGDLFSRTLGISGVVALAFSHSHTCTLPSCVRRARQGVCGQRNKVERPRAESHQRTLLTARSSSPLSEPSLKELHTRRAPLGLGQSQVGGIQARSYTMATRSKLPICMSRHAWPSFSSLVLRWLEWEIFVTAVAPWSTKPRSLHASGSRRSW